MTPVLEVGKSLESKGEIITSITNEMETIVKALGNGNRTDESLYSLEMRHKFLSSQLAEIAGMTVEQTDVKQNLITELKSFDWSTVFNNVK
jgi:hypothetical protein